MNPESIHGQLNEWMAEIAEELISKGERLDAADIALRLYHKIRKCTHKWRMQMLEVLAQEGAHQIAMGFCRQYGPSREATIGQMEEALIDKEKVEREPYIKWGDVDLNPDESEIVSALDKYKLRQIKTKTWGYILIVKASAEQLREAIALRGAQIQTMQIENDLLERLAKLRE